MRPLRIAGSCLVMALATAGVAATGALAGPSLPEWGKCIAKARAPYSDPGCTEHAATRSGGSYAWVHLIESTEVVVTKAGPTVLETTAGKKIDCESSGATWSLPRSTVKKVINGQVTFNGCVEPESGESCGSPASEPLYGLLGFVSGGGSAEPSVGLLLYSAQARRHKQRWFQTSCGGSKLTLKGAVISTVAPINTMTNTFTRTYSESSPGIQSIINFEGAGGEALEMNFHLNEAFAQTALIQEAVTTTEEPVEIRAVVK